MSLQIRDEDTRSVQKMLEEEVTVVKDTMAHVFMEKAIEEGGRISEKEAGFLYLVGSLLSRLDVKYHPDPELILATDGDTIYVGPAYYLLKNKLELTAPKLWKKLRYALVLHEAVHVLYAHHARIKLVDDPELYNIVADLLVNTIVESKLRVRIPPDFVTLRSFPEFLRKKLGINLSREKEKIIYEVADKFLRGELSTEDVYKIFESLEPRILNKIREHFRKGFFFGHDLADKGGQRFVPPSPRQPQSPQPYSGQSRETTSRSGQSVSGALSKEGKSGGQESTGEDSEEAKEKQSKSTTRGRATGKTEKETGREHGEEGKAEEKTGKKPGKSGGKAEEGREEEGRGKGGGEQKKGKEKPGGSSGSEASEKSEEGDASEKTGKGKGEKDVKKKGEEEGREGESSEEKEKTKGRGKSKKGEKAEEKGKGKGSGEESGEEKEGEGEEGKGKTAIVKPGKLAREGKHVERTLRDIREEISRILEEVRHAMGEYKAIKYAFEKQEKRHAGRVPGVLGEAEYKKMRTLTIPLEAQFLREVGESLSEPKVTYTRYDEDAYWLPAEKEEERQKVLLLLDSSPSIANIELKLFMNLVRKAMEIYDIEYEVSVFSVGEVDHQILNLDEFNEKTFRVKRGLGTVWDRTIAERIRKATDEGVKLIQVLSDFYINIKPEVLEEIKRFKALGGRISCYSVTRKYLDICDFKHNIRLV